MSAVVAIDQGTTATKVVALDEAGTFSMVTELRHRQLYPRPGWVEHDPLELERRVREGLAAGSAAAGGRPAAFGLDNQGETVMAWDAHDGRPLYNAIVWQDDRTRDVVEAMARDGAAALTLERAGLPLDPYFSASKLRWLLDNAPGASALLRAGRLRLGTSDSFLIERLTGVYATDVTTASRTSLMNLRTCEWDPDLCALFGVPREALPVIRSTTGDFGTADAGQAHVALRTAVVDQQAALFGHGCVARGDVKMTFGTGAFALANTGGAPICAPGKGMLATIAWQLEGQTPVYAMDGGIYHAGAAVEWIRRLGLFGEFAELEGFDGPPAACAGLFFVPALSGLGCPYWDRSATGLWIGMRPETTRRDLCRAVLEGVALRAAQLLDGFAAITAVRAQLPVDGGLTRNDYFCRMLAAAATRNVVLPAAAEMTGYGTARLTLLGAGLCARVDDLPAAPAPRASYPPTFELGNARERFDAAVERSRGWW